MATHTRRPDESSSPISGVLALREAGILLLTPEAARQACLLDGWDRQAAMLLLMDLDPAIYASLQEVAIRWSNRGYFDESRPDPLGNQQLADYRKAVDELGRDPVRHRLAEALERAEDVKPPRLRFPVAPREIMEWAVEKGFTTDCPTLLLAWQAISASHEFPLAADRWPWGSFETRLLAVAGANIREHWEGRDPARGPSKDAVVAWLRETYPDLTQNEAEAIDLVTRPDTRRNRARGTHG